ncbi:Gfo/Idh/MocA family protein [Rubrobacter marinus]|uniref:Gfo/Idh/MocA family protein n=1 Tax=Rubrobacter marinus TaxID=2653852 RepID=UPI001A9D8FBC|nr:Gfo/Idh/MocA family oxidoreductase [Rubrobacter marinus]
MFRVAVLSFWHVHARDYAGEAEEHPGAEVVAVWDEDPRRGRAEAEGRGVDFHEDLDEVLAREDVDGVVVTTPTVAHREVIPAAAGAGKHVFTEKVVAPTLREAEEIAAEAGRAGIAFVVSLPRLYAGYTSAIAEIIDRGELGEITYLRVRVSHDGALPTETHPGGWLPERFFDPRESAGGVTIDFGAHPLYLVARLLGVPEEVSAAYGCFTGGASKTTPSSPCDTRTAR